MEEVKKNSFFKDFLKSIKSFEKYEDFALEGMKKSSKYILKLILLFCLIVSISSTIYIFSIVHKVFNDLKNTTVNFSFKNNELNVESDDTIEVDNYKNIFGKIIINTSDDIKEEELIEKTKYDNTGIFLLKDKAILSTSNGAKREIKYEYLINNINAESEPNEFNINNKDELIELIESVNLPSYILMTLFIIFISNIILHTIDFFMFIIILSLVAYIIARISKMKINFSNSFGIAIHAITLPIVLNLIYLVINTFTRFEIKYFDWMFSSIAYIYVVVAILMIKTDFINRQLQLLRISEAKEKENKKEKEPPVEEKEEKKEKKKREDKEKNEEEPDSLNGSEA